MNLDAQQSRVLELVQTLNEAQLAYLLRVIQSLQSATLEHNRCTLRGKFSRYANPALRSKEKEAWFIAAEEKYGLR